MKLGIALLVALFSIPVMAADGFKTDLEFAQFIEKYHQNSDAYEVVDVALEDLGKTEKVALMKAANDSADVWADTVLEGPYVESGDPLYISGVELIYNSQGDLLAYYVSFGRKAWHDNDDCALPVEDFDGKSAEEIYANCPEGSIDGYVFVSGNLQFSRDDWDNPADFND